MRTPIPAWLYPFVTGRQDDRCGLCGRPLARSIFHLHHVNGCGFDHRPANLVALCVVPDGGCHLRAHYGDFRKGLLMPQWKFPYWRGARRRASGESR